MSVRNLREPRLGFPRFFILAHCSPFVKVPGRIVTLTAAHVIIIREIFMPEQRIACERVSTVFFKVFGSPALRSTALGCVSSMFYNFFGRQYRAALFPGKIPVSLVDHELDGKIPFTPSWIGVYLDFVHFWVRTLGFLLRVYGEKGLPKTGEFLKSLGELYAFAAEVYAENLSTTKRPFYIRKPRFLLIHMADPHLMCIPSLHVMVVIRTYTKFAEIIRSLGDGERYASRIEELRQGALDITEAVLYVKQHSVNCVAAAMYAMTCFEEELFPPGEAADFVSRLFVRSGPDSSAPLSPPDGEAVRKHIHSLYLRFLAGREEAERWTGPLLRFLRAAPSP
jgi:hypothetical protein